MAITKTAPLNVGDMLKEAGLAALVAAALTVPLIGFRTLDIGARLGLETRWPVVIASVALVFLGRIALILTRNGLHVPVVAGSIIMALLAYYTDAWGRALDLPMAMLQALTGPLRFIAFVGALVLGIQAALAWRRSTRPQPVSSEVVAKRKWALSELALRFGIWLAPLGILFAFVLPFLVMNFFPAQSRYVLDIGILILTYVMLGWGLNIIVGLAGLLDLGYVAFYAVGAYSYALLAHYYGFSFWICLPLAGILAATWGLILGFPVLRLRGDYFAIVTLGFGEIIRIILLNWYQFTGGPNGISGIPRPSFFGIAEFERNPGEGQLAFHNLFGLDFSPLHRIIFLYYLILALALLVNFFTLRIRRLPIGRAWEALREDDIACTALGINRTNIKLAAFAMSAMFGGIAGSFFATRQGFISPESFTFIESAIILAIVVLGGMGSQVGVVVATLLIIGLPEVFRELEQYRMLAFGAGMVMIMIWRPRGLLSHREPTILMHRQKSMKQPFATEARS